MNYPMLPVHLCFTSYTSSRTRFKHTFYHLLLLRLIGTLLFQSPNGITSAMTILHSKKQAIVLVDPLTDYQRVIEAASKANPPYHIIAVRMTGIDLNPNIQKFIPTPTALYDAGVDDVVAMDRRDVYSCTHELRLLEGRAGIRIKGVVPLSEIAVDVSDMLAASLGKPHNPLETVLCRRDKGFMKDIVVEKGLRVARFARIGSGGNESGDNGDDGAVGTDGLRETMERIGLDFPVVIKTPQGMSTTDVYICRSMNEAETALSNIVGSIGPDGRPVQYALLEEYIHGTEFAVNLMTFRDDHNDDKDNTSEIHVTDVWKYEKDDRARYISAEICDPNDPTLRNIVEYAKLVARAVGVHYGAAHVELKAVRNTPNDEDGGTYTDPVMIEVGARLSGGRKAIMAAEAVPNWDPFTELLASHCGQPPFSNKNDLNCSNTSGSGVDPTFFSPRSFVRHVFLTVDRPGRILSVQQPNTTAYKTIHSYVTIVGVGDEVRETTDITTCAGFGWLVGERTLVDLETSQMRSEFRIVMEQDEVS